MSTTSELKREQKRTMMTPEERRAFQRDLLGSLFIFAVLAIIGIATAYSIIHIVSVAAQHLAAH
jgi:hypothetical protein